MKLWMVKRTDWERIDYEEYKKVAVRAPTADEAVRIVCEKKKLRGFLADRSNAAAERITVDGKSGIILAEHTGA